MRSGRRARVVTVAGGVVLLGALLGGCATPETVPQGGPTNSSAGSDDGDNGDDGEDEATEPSPTSPFALGPDATAALGDNYCVAVVRPRRAFTAADVVRRLGGTPSSVHLYDEGKDGEAFREGADELEAATPGVEDAGQALYRIAEQAGAWTIYQASGRRCIADTTLTALTAGGGKAMAYTRDVDGEARLALAVDGKLLVNLNPGILPDASDRRGVRQDALSADDLSELQLAAEGEGDLDVPAAGLIERQCGVRLDDKWLAGPSQLVQVAGR